MSIGETPGTVETERTVDMPADYSPPAETERASEKEAKELLVGALAKADDAGDYVAERDLQEKEFRRGERTDEADRQGRVERARHARELLLAEQRELRGEQPAIEQSYVPAENAEGDPSEEARADGAFRVRLEQARERLPDFNDQVSMFDYLPLRDDVEKAIIRSPVGPELAYMLAGAPDAIDALNACSPAEATRWLTKLETKIELDRMREREQQPEPQSRRQTQAPPPLRTPAGGAAPSRDLHALARSDDMAAYVRERNREEAARRR